MSVRVRRPLAALALVAAVLLAACAPGPGTGSGGTDAAGAWGSTVPGETGLVVRGDGTLVGHDSCNGFSGDWHEEGDRLVVGELMQTTMECVGPDVDTWLSRIRAFRTEGERLVVMDADGVEIGTLERP